MMIILRVKNTKTYMGVLMLISTGPKDISNNFVLSVSLTTPFQKALFIRNATLLP